MRGPRHYSRAGSSGSRRLRLDVLPEIKQRGSVLYSNEEPQVCPQQFSRVQGWSWNDIRVPRRGQSLHGL